VGRAATNKLKLRLNRIARRNRVFGVMKYTPVGILQRNFHNRNAIRRDLTSAALIRSEPILPAEWSLR
jgi:hypothetical protein